MAFLGSLACRKLLQSRILRPLQGHDAACYLCRADFFVQLRPAIDTNVFQRVEALTEDGLYLHKRHIRGEHGKMLEQAGTVLQHTTVYIKEGEQARKGETPCGCCNRAIDYA